MKPFHWTTDYSSTENKSHTEKLWDQIQPSHGFIAIDRTWAEHHKWPESMYLPSDKTKGVYLLEAYHYLHCLASSQLTAPPGKNTMDLAEY